MSTDVVEHVFWPRLLLSNCFQLLKPGGSIVVSTPYYGYFKNLAIALTNGWDSHHDPLLDYSRIKFFSVRTLSKLLLECGFRHLKWDRLGRCPLLWREMIVQARV